MTAPGAAPGGFERALSLHQAGRLDEAARLYGEVLAAEPRHVGALHMLGMLEDERGRYAEAERLFGEALDAEPRSAIAALKRGAVLHRLGRLEEGATSFERALTINRDLAEGWHGLGLLLLDWRGPEAALSCYARALALSPGDPAILVNRANALRRLGRAEQGLPWFARALAARPDYAEAHYNRGLALQDLRRFDDAIRGYRRALALRPALIEAWSNVSGVLLGMGGRDDAIAAVEHAAALSPSRTDIARSRLSMLLYREPAGRRFLGLAVAAAKRAAPIEPLPPPDSDRDPDRVIRVGFVSSDFHFHPVARNIRALFAHRDRGAFSYLCYAHERRRDDIADWYRAHADAWRPVQDLSDRAVAELIRQDRVDVLVLLAGYFDRNRPRVAAWRAAPVQVSMYDAATSGIAEMDYFVGDPILTPTGTTEPFVEIPVRTWMIYNHAPRTVLPVWPRRPGGDGAVVFGSFNNPNKLTADILRLWGQVLARLPKARLLLKYKDDYARPWLQRKVLAEIGGGSEVAGRVGFVAVDEQEDDHLARHGEIDIALDSHPFSGATTSFDALWMGVPVVTLAGGTFLSRMTASHLIPLGLADLVASTPEEYVNIAVALALDPPRLAALRSSLRERLLASPLMDATASAKGFEALLRRLWQRWASETAG